MEQLAHCRCCLVRPPDKDLKTPYNILGKEEVYAEMLKDCFEIHLALGTSETEGICEVCVMRLRDACNFKHQVQKCQVDFQQMLTTALSVKDETNLKVKQELADLDDDNDGIYFLELKDEISDFEDLKEEDEDNKKLVELLGIKDITIKKKHTSNKKRNAKKKLVIDKRGDRKKKKTRMISIRDLKDMNTLLKPKLVNIRLMNENAKYKINIENILKYSNCTPFSNKTLAGIVCAYCKETYQSPKDLRLHINDVHHNNNLIDKKRMDKNNLSVKMDITDLKCRLCDVNFNVISNLKEHLTQAHDVKFYPDINDYILEFKLTEGEVLKCALCNSTFETFKMLLQHMNGHYRNYICGDCDLGFINKHRLKSHQRTHDIGTFNCTFCDKVFSTKVRKMCHEKYTHNSQARYTTSCPHCEKSFTSYYQRNRHMFQEHNIAAATYKCNICDKSFILKSKLTAHIKKVHLMERNHICAECGQGFFIKQSLDEHMIKHNGERVFKCTVCHKAYARKKTLREHMRIHNNDRRFKCGVCALAFVQKCSLKSHMLSNHGLTLHEYEATKAESSTDGL